MVEAPSRRRADRRADMLQGPARGGVEPGYGCMSVSMATAGDPLTDMLTRSFWSLLRIGLGFFTILSNSNAADAEFSRQVWINPGIYSHHFDRSTDFRESNVGLGAEVLLAPDHALMGGSFINSQSARTRYGAYQWRPLHWQPGGIDLSAGIILGAFDGYPNYRDGGWFLAPMPVLAIEGNRFGVNLSIVPKVKEGMGAAIAVQIKLRVW
jgi:hypothetical protein